MPSRTISAGNNTRIQDDDDQYVLIIIGLPSRSDWRELKDFLRKTLAIRYVRRVEVYHLNDEGIDCGTFDVRGTSDAYRCYDALRNFGYNNCPVSVGLLRENGSTYETLERSIKVRYAARTAGPARVHLLSPLQPGIQSTLQPAIERQVDISPRWAHSYLISFLRESISTPSHYHTLHAMPPTIYSSVPPIGQAPAQTVVWNPIPSIPSTHLNDTRICDPNRLGQRPTYISTPPRIVNRAPSNMSGISGQNRSSQGHAFREYAGTSASYRLAGSMMMQGNVGSTSLAQINPPMTYMGHRPQALSSRGSGRRPRDPASNRAPRPQATEFFPRGTSEPSNGPLICDGSANSSRRPRYVSESDDEDT